MTSDIAPHSAAGLSLAPFRARRFAADPGRLAALLSPPYDVISDAERAALLLGDADNVVSVILPQAPDDEDPYQLASDRLARWTTETPGRGALLPVDRDPALYVYEMAAAHSTTRGLIGAVELRDPAEGVILPHENVMAGPVADRLALMDATSANLEPIYLVYPGGGAASDLVASMDAAEPIASATTADGITHRLWAVIDPAVHARVSADLNGHSAVIADGHHRYATYRELQRRRRATHGAGPWDRGLTLLVDTSRYGAHVDAIHRVVPGLDLADAIDRLSRSGGPSLAVTPVADIERAVRELGRRPPGPPAAVVVAGPDGGVLVEGLRAPDGELGSDLDVVAVHRDLIERRWGLEDTVKTVGYAHDVAAALDLARRAAGVAVLLRPTPVAAVMEVARAGGRMPRKSTLFTPKPASGLVIRRFADG